MQENLKQQYEAYLANWNKDYFYGQNCNVLDNQYEPYSFEEFTVVLNNEKYTMTADIYGTRAANYTFVEIYG